MNSPKISRKAFEEWVSSNNWSTAPMIVNGKFSHYIDPDVDNMWMGYKKAGQAAFQMQKNNKIDILEAKVSALNFSLGLMENVRESTQDQNYASLMGGLYDAMGQVYSGKGSVEQAKLEVKNYLRELNQKILELKNE